MKFKEFFSRPQYMSNGDYVISGYIPLEIAVAELGNCVGKVVGPSDLTIDRVRFQFPGEDIEDREDLDKPCWCTGAGGGKGTKPIWVLRRETCIKLKEIQHD